MKPRIVLLWVTCLPVAVALLSSCSVKRIAVNKLGNALASGGSTFTSDEDPELVRDALPFSLKLIESLLAESPRHRGLLFAASSGFTPYAYAFVQEEADEIEAQDLEKATALRARARRLYLRARDYGIRGLEVAHAGFGEALIDRALALDESYGDGAVHSFLITYEASRNGARGDFAVRSRKHFDRAMELSGGHQAGPLVSLAETVSIQKQDQKEFQSLLERALGVDVNAKPEFRLANLIMQRRARWLLSRADELFLEEAETR